MFDLPAENLDEEKFVGGYMRLADCTESFARCVFMFLEVAASRQNDVHHILPPATKLVYGYDSSRPDQVD